MVNLRNNLLFDNPKSRRDSGKIATIENAFTAAYTKELLEVVERLNRTRLAAISRIESVGSIFRIVLIAPVAQ